MIVKNKRLEKLCCFYVSEFHLEMILVPYINNVIEKNKKISILTEINLEETIKILMSKINLSEKRKKEIEKVTKEDIIKFSKKIHMDTIYLLEGEA